MKSSAISLYEIITPWNNYPQAEDVIPTKRYIKTYRKLPSGFIHAGNMFFYKTEKKTKIREIAKEAIVYTHFYKIYKLKKAIKEYNGLRKNSVKKDRVIYIPFSLPPILPDMRKLSKTQIKYIRALYYSGSTAGSEKIWQTVNRFKKVGINAIVFDAKDVTGIVNYNSNVPSVRKFNTHKKRTIDDVDQLIRVLKNRGIYVITRISVFRDSLLCKKAPDLAIRSKRTGGIWNSGSGELWCDPTNKIVQDYNIDIAVELAEKGVDEIQFDYIRFPTVGDFNDADLKYHFGKATKEVSIAHFLKRAYSVISKRNTLLSIDIFGVVAWGKSVDIKKTGQRIELLSKYCDIISPMLYPSHFNDDFDKIQNPGDNPYYFIYQGCKKVAELSDGRVVRPWLQAFKWRTPTYGQDYIRKEIIASRDSGALGYMFWNAKNKYETVYMAMSRMNKEDL
ncbi:MAG: putative glycoside hydrolase [Spirochaetota bacterium]|nr:putative glycoside hydrolase [Spirochaetota bacterium]